MEKISTQGAFLAFILIALVVGVIDAYPKPKLVFKKEHSNSHYAKILVTLPDIMELTICYWFKPYVLEDHKHHIFSYSGRREPDQILTWYKRQGPAGSPNTTVGINIRGLSVLMNATVKQIKANQWSHICYSWNPWSQQGAIFLNSSRVETNIQLTGDLTPVQLKIKTGGVVVLGQDQDVYGGGFEKMDAFKGELYGLQLWDEKLQDINIARVGQCLEHNKGNVLSWMDQSTLLKDVFVEKSDKCSS